MVTSPGKACRPRRYGGTRSPRYAARRAERGTVVAYAPSWSDAGATTVLEALHTRCSGPGCGGEESEKARHRLRFAANKRRGNHGFANTMARI